MRKLMFVFFILSVSVCFAVGSRQVYIGVADLTATPYDFSTAPYDYVTFIAWIQSRPTEVLTQDSNNSGYEDFGCGVSAVYFDLGNFPTAWATGDVLVVLLREESSENYGFEGYYQLTLSESQDIILVGLDTWFGEGVSTNLPYSPILISTVYSVPVVRVNLGVTDSSGDIYDFSTSPYDNVTFQAWLSGNENDFLNENTLGSGYYTFENKASIIYFNIYKFPTYWSEGDTLRISVKQDTDGPGYFTGEAFYILEEYYPSETVIRIGLDSLYGEGLGGGPPIPVNVWVDETGIEQSFLPSEISLNQNYPNPFNPETGISFSLPKEEQVTLSVFNSEGQLVKELVNGRVSAGNHSVNFNAENLNSGIYFYTLETVSTKLSKKMLLIK